MKTPHFLIYKVVNVANGKYYIGKHKTFDLDDGYLGSGRAITAAVKKYGTDNFVKEILFVFDTELEMTQKEIELVTEDVVLDPGSYNIALGGQGGNLGPVVNKKISIKTSEALKGKPKSDKHKQAIKQSKTALDCSHTEETKKKIGVTVKKTWNLMSTEERKKKCGRQGAANSFYNRTHKKESIDKMKETIGDSRKGSLNPRAKSITVNGVTYPTYKECMETLRLNKRQFYKFLGEL